MPTPEDNRKHRMARALANAHAAGDTEAAKAIAKEMKRLAGPTPYKLSEAEKPRGTPGERFGMGVGYALMGPVQAAANAIDTLDPTNRYSAAPVNEMVNEMGRLREQANAPGLEAGDVASFTGEAAPYLMAGGTSLPGPVRSALQRGRPWQRAAKTGAAAGGAVSAVAPVEGDQYWAGKAVQLPQGVGGGALLGPLAGQVAGWAGRMLNRGPAARVGSEYRREIADQVRSARATGGEVNREAIANAKAAERLGVERLLTRGQIERDPAQFGREEFIRNAPGGEVLAQNFNEAQARMNQHLAGLQSRAGSALDRPTAGARVMKPLEETARYRQDRVGALYDKAQASAGRDAQINGAKLANDVYAQIEGEVSAPLPGHIASAMNKFASGELPLDVNRAQQLIKAVNRAYGGADDATRHSLSILKSKLDEALAGTGAMAADAFKLARTAAARNKQLQDQIPALKAVVDESVTADQFLDRFILGAGKDASLLNVQRLKGVLMRSDPGAWAQVRGQVVDSLRTAAGFSENASVSKLNPVSFDRALSSLKQSGKLDALFDKGEIQLLNDIARVGRAMSERPAAVSGTGLGGAARLSGLFARLMERISAVPGVSQVAGAASGVVMPAVRGVQARNALSSHRFGTLGNPPTQARNALAAGSGVIAPLADD